MRTQISTRMAVLAAALACSAVTIAPAAALAQVRPVRHARDVREVTIPAGTALRLRLESGHASNTSRPEERVQAHLIAPVVVQGVTVLPSNTAVSGHVSQARPAGKVKGRGYLALRFTDVRADDERYRVTTRTWARQARGTKQKDAAKIAVPGAVGGVMGAIVGGKKGAAIGAGVGAGAGTAVVLSTTGDNVHLPRGSTVLVRLSQPLTVRVPS